MKPNAVAALLLGCWIGLLPDWCSARIFFIGPNVYFSMQHFPQDGLRWRGRGSLIYYDRRMRGWFGNLDTPAALPSANYTLTKQSLRLSGPQSEFYLDSGWATNRVVITPYFSSYRGIAYQTLVSFDLESFHFNAQGIARSQNENSEWELVPFRSELRRRNHHFALGGAVAFSLAGLPIGVRLVLNSGRTGEPTGQLKYVKAGVNHRLNKFTWGWTSQQGCNHILASHANIDAWWQTSYEIASSRGSDIVVGTTISDHKLALRWRTEKILGEEFHYDEQQDKYLRDGEWRTQTIKNMIRLYGLVPFYRLDHTTFSLVGFAERDNAVSTYIGQYNKERLDKLDQTKYLFELTPVVTVLLKENFINSGLLLFAGKESFAYLDIWDRQQVYQPGYAHLGWSTYWEKPSYGGGPFYGYGLDVNIEFSILKRPGLKFRGEIWRLHQRTHTTKHYGRNDRIGEIYQFREEATRKDFRSETWMSGSLGMWLNWQEYFFGWFLDLPISYAKTEVTDVSMQDGSGYFSDRQVRFPAVQEPYSLKFVLGKKW